MASVNIGGGDDQFNRYKMPPVIGKVEGRGNGIKTRIVNCVEVAKALHRPPGYVCKFFGCELGAQTKINDDQGVYIVNGSFNQNKLSEVLQLFIKMFVLCGNCNLPETDLKVKRNGDIKQLCNACGAETLCDMTHKLCTFIGNNPPDGKKKSSGKKSKGDKNQRRAKKLAAANANNSNSSTSALSETTSKNDKKIVGDILPMGAEFDIAAAADAAAEQLASNGSVATSTVGGISSGGAFSMMMSPEEQYDDGDDDGVEWSVDTSKEAQEARLVELGVNLSILERGAKDEEEPLAIKLRDYIDQGKKASRVLTKAEKLFGAERVVHGVLAASVVNESKENIPNSVQKRAVKILATYGTPMDKESQMEYCEFLDIYGEDATVRAVLAHILKKGFDADLLEEEVIFSWYKKQDGRKDVREAVKVYVEWLENAEEESSSDEESE